MLRGGLRDELGLGLGWGGRREEEEVKQGGGLVGALRMGDVLFLSSGKYAGFGWVVCDLMSVG